MKNFIKKLLGRNKKTEEVIKNKQDEAEVITVKMGADILRIKKRIDNINVETNKKLNQISDDLGNVTYRIAIATGGSKRGVS